MPRNPRHTGPGNAAPGKRFVDSGAWIALVSARDQRHPDANAMFRRAVARRASLLTINLVLAEVHRLLLFRAWPRPAARALDRFESSAHVTIELAAAVHHRAARAWLDRRADHAISYTDAVSFAVMQAIRCTAALSFDHDFRIAGFSLWTAEP